MWRDGEAGIQSFLALVEHYASHGHPVEIRHDGRRAAASPADAAQGGRRCAEPALGLTVRE